MVSYQANESSDFRDTEEEWDEVKNLKQLLSVRVGHSLSHPHVSIENYLLFWVSKLVISSPRNNLTNSSGPKLNYKYLHIARPQFHIIALAEPQTIFAIFKNQESC